MTFSPPPCASPLAVGGEIEREPLFSPFYPRSHCTVTTEDRLIPRWDLGYSIRVAVSIFRHGSVLEDLRHNRDVKRPRGSLPPSAPVLFPQCTSALQFHLICARAGEKHWSNWHSAVAVYHIKTQSATINPDQTQLLLNRIMLTSWQNGNLPSQSRSWVGA